MSLVELASKIGAVGYPERFAELYEKIDLTSKKVIDFELLKKYQEVYNICGEYYDAVVRGGEDILKNPDALAWLNATVAYRNTCSSPNELNLLRMPESDGTPAWDMLPFYALISQLEYAIELHNKCGFSHKEVVELFATFPATLSRGLEQGGRPMLSQPYYAWNNLYIFARIFSYGSLNFERRSNVDIPATLFKNKTTGELLALANDVRVDSDGYATAPDDNSDGSFDAKIVETDTEFIGHPTNEKSLFLKDTIRLKKSEWEILFKKRDDTLSLHIPRNADFSKEALDDTLTVGKRIHRERFLNESHYVTTCMSWLMDPVLEDMLGENSNLVKFEKRFVRVPMYSPSKHFLVNIFPNTFTLPPEEWEENTTLQRKVKELYLSGGMIHTFGGILIE